MQTRYTWMYAYLQVTDEKKFNQGERKERKIRNEISSKSEIVCLSAEVITSV